jgi:hypothetical protein
MISQFFWEVIEGFVNGKTEQGVLQSIQDGKRFSYLTHQMQSHSAAEYRQDFSSDVKSAVYIREVLQSAPRCNICKGFIHKNSISIDHIQRKQDGGMGAVENGQLTHPYCNTGYKN